jgi:hypothetical protein
LISRARRAAIRSAAAVPGWPARPAAERPSAIALIARHATGRGTVGPETAQNVIAAAARARLDEDARARLLAIVFDGLASPRPGLTGDATRRGHRQYSSGRPGSVPVCADDGVESLHQRLPRHNVGTPAVPLLRHSSCTMSRGEDLYEGIIVSTYPDQAGSQ